MMNKLHLNSKVLVIAEAGVNHNGDINLAKKLIDVAKAAKADYVKFQTFEAKNLTTKIGELAEYQKKQVGDYSNQYEMLKSLELTKEMHEDLISYCDQVGIKFLSTAFDVSSLKLLLELDCKLIKIPSGDLTNYFLLSEAAKTKLPIILSTGMGSYQEISAALKCLYSNGAKKEDIVVLHCTTEYPCEYSEVNLLAMIEIKKKFGVQVGYSDHTKGISVSLAAVSLGATVIEKHFTLDRTMTGPDHEASLEPDELISMVSEIRNVSSCLGDKLLKPTASEIKNIQIARKSLVAKKSISVGDIFSIDNVVAKRPENGISPMEFPKLDGKISDKNYSEDESIVMPSED